MYLFTAIILILTAISALYRAMYSRNIYEVDYAIHYFKNNTVRIKAVGLNAFGKRLNTIIACEYKLFDCDGASSLTSDFGRGEAIIYFNMSSKDLKIKAFPDLTGKTDIVRIKTDGGEL